MSRSGGVGVKNANTRRGAGFGGSLVREHGKVVTQKRKIEGGWGPAWARCGRVLLLGNAVFFWTTLFFWKGEKNANTRQGAGWGGSLVREHGEGGNGADRRQGAGDGGSFIRLF